MKNSNQVGSPPPNRTRQHTVPVANPFPSQPISQLNKNQAARTDARSYASTSPLKRCWSFFQCHYLQLREAIAQAPVIRTLPQRFAKKSLDVFVILFVATIIGLSLHAFQTLTTNPSSPGFQSAGAAMFSKTMVNPGYDRTTDSLEAISDKIGSGSAISDRIGSNTDAASTGLTIFATLNAVTGTGFSLSNDSLHSLRTKIDALPTSGGGGSPSLGADMLNQYFMSAGLFTPHTNNCNGTEGFVEVKSGSGLGFCIEKTYRGAQTWEEAKMACSNAGKRLPEPFEWKYTCRHPPSGWSYSISQWEWASNFALPVYNGGVGGVGAAIAGNGGCQYFYFYWVGATNGEVLSNPFRCVR